MSNLKPFRDYSEHDVINLFAVSGESVNKGTVVVSDEFGVNFSEQTLVDDISPYANTVSSFLSVPWTVYPAPSGATKGQIVGLLLKDVRSFDENGEQLLFKPRKAAEMDVIVNGQVAPILTRGIVLVDDIIGNPGFGSGAAVSDSGNGALKVVPYANATVGKFLGTMNEEGYALLKIEL